MDGEGPPSIPFTPGAAALLAYTATMGEQNLRSICELPFDSLYHLQHNRFNQQFRDVKTMTGLEIECANPNGSSESVRIVVDPRAAHLDLWHCVPHEAEQEEEEAQTSQLSSKPSTSKGSKSKPPKYTRKSILQSLLSPERPKSAQDRQPPIHDASDPQVTEQDPQPNYDSYLETIEEVIAKSETLIELLSDEDDSQLDSTPDRTSPTADGVDDPELPEDDDPPPLPIAKEKKKPTIDRNLLSEIIFNGDGKPTMEDVDSSDECDEQDRKAQDEHLMASLWQVIEEDEPWNTYVKCDPDDPKNVEETHSVRVDGSLMAANSIHFRKVLINFRKKCFKTPIIELNGVEESLFEALYAFMGHATVEVPPEKLERLYNLAHILQVSSFDEIAILLIESEKNATKKMEMLQIKEEKEEFKEPAQVPDQSQDQPVSGTSQQSTSFATQTSTDDDLISERRPSTAADKDESEEPVDEAGSSAATECMTELELLMLRAESGDASPPRTLAKLSMSPLEFTLDDEDEDENPVTSSSSSQSSEATQESQESSQISLRSGRSRRSSRSSRSQESKSSPRSGRSQESTDGTDTEWVDLEESRKPGKKKTTARRQTPKRRTRK